MFGGLLDEDKVFAPAQPAQPQQGQPDILIPDGDLLGGNTDPFDDPLYKEERRKESEADIQNSLIDAQRELANLQDKIDAHMRLHNSAPDAAKMYMWAQTVFGTANKVKELTRLNLLDYLPSSTNKFNIKLGTDVYMLKRTITVGGLDTTNFKKLDRLSYDKMALKFPKKASKRHDITIKDIGTFTSKNLGVIDAKD